MRRCCIARDCGWKSGCPHCSAWRVFHKLDRTLRCHHCGFSERVPRACPDCGNLDIAPIGRGTERLEEQLARAAAAARASRRIDADTTRAQGRARGAARARCTPAKSTCWSARRWSTKGHDFRRVTLVAAVNPDSALFSSDFRAPERLFALLMQAAGRAGRDAAQAARSEMWVQTWHPAPRAVRGAARARLRRLRRAASWPSARRPGCRRSRTSRCCAPRRATPTWRAAFLQRRRRAGARRWPRRGRRDDLPAGAARASRAWPTSSACRCWSSRASRVRLQRLLARWLPRLHALRQRPQGVWRAGRPTSIRWRSAMRAPGAEPPRQRREADERQRGRGQDDACDAAVVGAEALGQHAPRWPRSAAPRSA